MFGKNLNDPFQIPLGKTRNLTRTEFAKFQNKKVSEHEVIVTSVRDTLQLSRLKNRQHFDVRRMERSFDIGDLVLYKSNPLSVASSGVNAKLCNVRRGPYKIMSRESKTIYRIGDLVTGAPIARVHVSQIKPYIPRKSPDVCLTGD